MEEVGLENATTTIDSVSFGILSYASESEYTEAVTYATAIAVPVVFGLIFLVGIVGNGLLIYTVLANKPMRTNPNIFLVSLAVGDSLLLLVSVPFTAPLYTLFEWSFGVAMCKINEFMQTLSLGVSIFTLTAVAGDRFIAVVYPIVSYKWSTMRRTLQISAAMWLLSFVLAVPDLVSADVRLCPDILETDKPFFICDLYPVEWGPAYKQFRPLFRFIVYFVVPILVIATFYISIATTLLRKPLENIPIPAATSSNAAALAWSKQLRTRKKVSMTVLCIIVLFVVCWVPRYVYILWYRYGEPTYNMFVHIFKITGFCLSFAYSSVNPVALYAVTDDFHRYFDHYLFGCCCKSRRLKTRRGTMQSAVESGLHPAVGLNGKRVGSHTILSFTPGATPNRSLEDITKA